MGSELGEASGLGISPAFDSRLQGCDGKVFHTAARARILVTLLFLQHHEHIIA